MSKSPKIEYYINPSRLAYLLKLYEISKTEFVGRLNKTKNDEVRKAGLTDLGWVENVLNKKIKTSYSVLKRIDNIFNVGISWLVSSRELPPKNGSIFFRKKFFNSELDFNTRKIIDNFEKLKIETQLMIKYINYNPKRILKIYNQDESAETAAGEIASKFYDILGQLLIKSEIKEPAGERDYLKNLMRVMEEFNIFIFERTETYNQKERLIVDGLFMHPNYILIKRNQKHFRREIFSLAHEFAHYLLNIEEIDNIKSEFSNLKLSKIEQWCYTFAFYFLLHNRKDKYKEIKISNKENNYAKNIVDEIYNGTHLSHRAIYTRLVIENKITRSDYDKKIIELNDYIKKIRQEEKLKREKDKELGKEQRGSAPKPIESKFFTELVKINYFEGNINEGKLREYLRISPDKSIKDVIYS